MLLASNIPLEVVPGLVLELWDEVMVMINVKFSNTLTGVCSE